MARVKKTEKKPSNAPKRPATPYIKFCAEQRKKNKDLEGKTVSEQGQLLGKLWKSLNDAEKKVFQDSYRAAKVVYDQEFEEYKKTDEYKEEMEAKKAAKVKKTTKTKRGATVKLEGEKKSKKRKMAEEKSISKDSDTNEE
ncbi:hypothetical protein GVAV_003333 [Gurleya vavrai]